MRAVVFNGPYDVSVETVPDPGIEEPSDAVVQVEAAAVCGSDLWTYRGQASVSPGARIGHEFLGRVVALGSSVTGLAVGDWVVAPFRYSDGCCEFCAEGLTSSCLHGGFWGREVLDAGQGEYVRVPQADGTLVRVGSGGAAPDPTMLPDLLTLADVMPTGLHAVTSAGVGPGDTVVVVGDGAVGQCAVTAARLAGAERVIVLGGTHADRENLARSLGADDFLSLRGEAAVTAIHELTGGRGARRVIECVGSSASFATALAVTRPGGSVGYVGLPHGVTIDLAQLFGRNITMSGGMCPARHYLPDLLEKVLGDEIHPGAVFTSIAGLEKAADAYDLMDRRTTIKAMLKPSSL
ncbi:zinc-binding dehydrogenase [Raineyella sp. W15-4]|uniref:zinc-binding dehydrogenase n=1 Tax=Raineyella sp. W15-4 TaxID=3081651 RepID=UPI00295528AF|nr:zinc-binding dehydrogenase [Raineyella sp. W15-4]WOQ15739.1 zinc-binding dehydrogenase [Raineyella sp. W15-4]